MYKLLLCWRYLRTRYIALASIVSVMLGVATMIVVNAVMAGFSHEMEGRMHDILSDVVIESHGMEGFSDAQWHMEAIEKFAGQWIETMTPTVHVPAALSIRTSGAGTQTRPVVLIGIDETTYGTVSDFAKYLQHPENRRQPSFELRNGGYDDRDHQAPDKAPPRPDMRRAGWPWRQWVAEREKRLNEARSPSSRIGTFEPGIVSATPEVDGRLTGEVSSPMSADTTPESGIKPPPIGDQTADAGSSESPPANSDPFIKHNQETKDTFDAAKQQHFGIILGIALASYRDHDGVDRFLVLPGDDVSITCPTVAIPPRPPRAADAQFTVVDFYESKMSEYDSTFVFAPIEVLQDLRVMKDPTTGAKSVSAIQIKLKPGANPDTVRDILRSKFPPQIFGVYTWRDKQGALLAAVQMERSVLNILLFMIIAVAGFGILAIFFMIVVEKTRDVGILKSLGASSRGVMGIFLGYGLSLGVVGAGVGLTIGLVFVRYINQIRSALEWLTGQAVFDPAIYYFYEIPTIVDPFTVGWIMTGALSIAVLASVLPALRAARLHPVEALRYE